ncbi:MAG: GyrI-like domain-containing protein [Gammaproteobacteria bacterium]|nr:GyrI-like domain-containing protein [Gammaproteobacteria bacterium]
MASNFEKTYHERILKVLIYIQNNLDKELSLAELSSTAFFSPFHFHRIFTALTGESIKSYVRRLRLERAIRDLTYTDLPIVKISDRAGYDTQQSFHRAFKETYHATPKGFRDKYQEVLSQQTQKQPGKVKTDIVKIEIIAPIQVAFVRHVGPYAELTQAWFQLIAELGINIVSSEKTQKIGIAHDAPDITDSEKLRYDACITLDEIPNFKAKGHVGIQTLHGGKYAVITHYGALEEIETTYRILFGVWLPQSGFEPADYPNFMVHRKTPFQTPAEQLVTDIYLPLK